MVLQCVATAWSGSVLSWFLACRVEFEGEEWAYGKHERATTGVLKGMNANL